MTKAEGRRLRALREATQNEQPLRVVIAALSGSYDSYQDRYLIPSETQPGICWLVDLENRHCPCPAYRKCYHLAAARLMKGFVERSRQNAKAAAQYSG